MSRQFPLRLSLSRCPTFDNFIVVNDNEEAVAAIMSALDASSATYLSIWGKDCGKSHLMMAACDSAEKRGASAIYLPLAEIIELSPDLLESLEQYQLVALDDIESICGNDTWEVALFNLYNRIRERNGTLLVTANSSPASLDIRLADLGSRLMWGASYQLHSLDDDGFRRLLKQIADEKGMQMKDELVSYLINRYARSASKLVTLMDQLDSFSLEQKKKLTIPLLRQWLSETDPSSAT